MLALGGALHHRLHQLAGRRLAQRLALGSTLRELARVRVGANRDPAVGLFGRPPRRRRDPLELGVGGVLKKAACCPSSSARRSDGPPASSTSLVDRPRPAARPPTGPRSRRCRPRRPWSSARRGSSPGSSTRGSLIASLSFAPASADPRAWTRSPSPSAARARASRRPARGETRRQHRPSRTATGCPSTSASTSTSAPALLDPRRADEDRAQRLGPDPVDRRSASKLGDLAAEGVAAAGRVEQAEVVAVADDHPGAGAEHRPARVGVRADRRPRPSRSIAFMIVVDSPPGDHQRVEAVERSLASAPRPPRHQAREHRRREPRSRPGWRARRRAVARPAPSARPRPLRPALLQQLALGGELGDVVAAHRLAETRRGGRDPLGVVEVGRRLDDRPRACARGPRT